MNDIVAWLVVAAVLVGVVATVADISRRIDAKTRH